MSARRLTCACVVALAAVFVACDDDSDGETSTGGRPGTGGSASTGGRVATGGRPATGGSSSDAGRGGAAGDTGAEAGAGDGGEDGAPLLPCLDRPGELQRPPSGRLPCDLLPPDFGQ